MRNILAALIFTATLASTTVSTLAEPIVSSVTGTLSHKASMTISGSSFGSKSPASPRIWDWCDDSSSDSLDTHYPGDTYPKSCSNPSETPFATAYRRSFHNFSTMPHSRITKFISGAAVTCNGSWTSEHASNLITTDTWEADTLFLMYYYRMSPTWGLDTSSSAGDNLKEVSANGCENEGSSLCGTYLNGADNYADFCNGQTPMIMNPNRPYLKGGSGCSSSQYVAIPNPMQGWVHLELIWDTSNGYKWSASDGSSATAATYWANHFLDQADGTNPRTISIGGFVRWPRENATGNYRYWAGIYADDTYARVMLGNNQNWNNCTIREPQIPSQWNNNQITCRANLGAFPNSGTAYLFVFDSSNNHNEGGFPVSLSGGGNQPPSPPSGLDVVNIGQ